MIPVAGWLRVLGSDRRRSRQPLSSREGLVAGTYTPSYPETVGLPAGTVLTEARPLNGVLRIDEAFIAANGGREADGRFYLRHRDVHGIVDVRADYVTVQRNLIRLYANSYGSSVSGVQSWAAALDLVIEDNTIDPGANARVGQDGITGTRYTARRNYIKGTVDGGKAWGDTACIIEGNLVEQLNTYDRDPAQNDGPSHGDGWQVQGGGPHVIRGNVFRIPLERTTAAIMVTQDHAVITAPITIDRNDLSGGAAVVNLSEKGKGPIVAVITDNVIGASGQNLDILVPDTTRAVSTITGNVKPDGVTPAEIRRG